MLRGQNVLLFVGHYEHSIDAKLRLAVPSEVRAQLDRGEEGPGLYAVIQEGPTLALYTEKGFEKRATELDQSQRPADEILEYELMFYSMANRVEIDKQGRIRLPERLIKLAGLERDVVILGVKDHLQIHDRNAWNQRFEQTMRDRPQLLMNPRRLLKPDNND